MDTHCPDQNNPTSTDAVAFIERAAHIGVQASLHECLERIHSSTLNAFVEVFEDEALERARYLDSLDPSERGRLHGLVVAVKDEVHVAGHVTGFGTVANSRVAVESSHIVQALEAEGAIMVGHTRMPEFGAWPLTESASGGITRNAMDPRFSPGGSSGGTATAVAGGLVPVGIGGDGGGSIRIPSAMCGLVGLKPRRGRVSPWPERHLWWALGVTGVLTRSVRDTALIYDIISGNRLTDLYQAPPMGSLVEALERDVSGLRFMIIDHALHQRVHPRIREAVARVGKNFVNLGFERVDGPRFLPDPSVSFIPQFFAGIRAEYAAVEHPNLLESRTKTVNRLGSWVTENVRGWAERRGEALAARINDLLDQADILVTPTLAAPQPRAGAINGKSAVATALIAQPYVAFTALFNVTGHPAISIPAPGVSGLPIGVQLIARDEETLICAAQHLTCAAQHLTESNQ